VLLSVILPSSTFAAFVKDIPVSALAVTSVPVTLPPAVILPPVAVKTVVPVSVKVPFP